MASLDDVRTVVQELPGVFEKALGHRGGAGWRTRKGLLVWERGPSKTDLAQLAELGRTWPGGTVLGVHVDGLEAKRELLEAFPETFFTIPHFEGYSAVLLQLERIGVEQLREVVTEAWLSRVSDRTAAEWLAERGLSE